MEYKRIKRNYRSLIQSEKLHYFDNAIIKSNNKSKSVWNVINSFRNTMKTDVTDVIEPDGTAIEGPQKIASLSNHYHLNCTMNENQTTYKNIIPININKESFFLTSVTRSEIIGIIDHLKNTYGSLLDIMGYNRK